MACNGQRPGAADSINGNNAPSTKGEPSLRIMTFDVRNERQDADQNSWDYRGVLITKLVENYAPDVVDVSWVAEQHARHSKSIFFGPAGNVCELSGLAAMVRRVLTIALVLLSSCVLVGCISNSQFHTTPLSLDSAIEPSLSRRLQISPNTARAKNVILFVGDGMGVSTVTASRIFDGQSLGQSGEEHVLSFEQFPHVALVKTYNTCFSNRAPLLRSRTTMARRRCTRPRESPSTLMLRDGIVTLSEV